MTVNSIFFVPTFILNRCVFQLYIRYVLWVPDLIADLKDASKEPEYKAVIVYIMLCMLLGDALNFWWSWLIIKQIRRIIKGDPNANSTFSSED